MEAEVYLTRIVGEPGEAESEAKGHIPDAISLRMTVSQIPQALKCMSVQSSTWPHRKKSQIAQEKLPAHEAGLVSIY